MDTDREFEHMMMSVRNSSGSITQMVLSLIHISEPTRPY